MHHFAAMPQRFENEASVPSRCVATTETEWFRSSSTYTGRASRTAGEVAFILSSMQLSVPAVQLFP